MQENPLGPITTGHRSVVLPSQTPFWDRVKQAISSERLAPYYRSEQSPDRETHAIARYAWNMRLAEALYPSLFNLEVTFRNSLYSVIDCHYRSVLSDSRHSWLYDVSSPLLPQERARVANTLGALRRQRKAISSGNLIAELTFGFWTSLLDARYEHSQRFWPTLLEEVFPKVPKRHRTRPYIFDRLDRIRRLRNRVFHHEPIWHWHDLKDQHRQILETLSWLNPDMMRWSQSLDRFPSVYAKGWLCLRAEPEPAD